MRRRTEAASALQTPTDRPPLLLSVSGAQMANEPEMEQGCGAVRSRAEKTFSNARVISKQGRPSPEGERS